MFKKIISLIGIFLLLPACATTSRGVYDTLVIDTQPSGATVTTDLVRVKPKTNSGVPIYYGCSSTPCEIRLHRKSEFILTLSKPGFEDVDIGVDGQLFKEALTANLGAAGVAGTGIALTAVGSLVAVSSAFGASAGTAIGSGVVLGPAAVAGIAAAAGTLIVSTGVDNLTGASYNLSPNPIFINLPPVGTRFEPHPKAEALKFKRDNPEEWAVLDKQRRIKERDEKRKKNVYRKVY